MGEPDNIYYRNPLGELWLDHAPEKVFEATMASLKTVDYLNILQSSTLPDYNEPEEGLFGKTIIGTGEMRFFRSSWPTGVYAEVSSHGDGSRLLLEIYFRNVKGFFIEVLGESILSRKYRSLENAIFNFLNTKDRIPL